MLYRYMLILLWACPTAARRLREFYLEHSNTTMSITEAREKCLHYTDLVTVYDQLDNNALKEMLMKQNATSAWIGAFFGKQWSDGTVATFKKSTNEDVGSCAAMKPNKEWENIKCNQGKNFTCYDRSKGTYNYTLLLLSKTWSEAQQYCRDHHVDLVTITNEQENDQVYEAGLNSKNPFWIGLQSNPSTQAWFDRGRSNYSNYMSKPLLENMLTYMDLNGSWIQSNTSDSNCSLCYKSFIHVNKNGMSWEDALDYCNRSASGLLRIESEEDQIETERELRRRHISDPVWIGLRQSRLFGFWMWVNGLHVGSWSNWKGGSPPEHQISHHCGAIEKVNGTFKWTDKDCRYRFIVLCEAR